jgi:hypothetical protein
VTTTLCGLAAGPEPSEFGEFLLENRRKMLDRRRVLPLRPLVPAAAAAAAAAAPPAAATAAVDACCDVCGVMVVPLPELRGVAAALGLSSTTTISS